MTRWLSRRRCLAALLALLPLACGRLHGEPHQQSVQTPPRFELSAEEVQAARTLAEHDLIRPENRISPADKIVFTKIELLPDAQAETTQRLVLVTHYCYRGDEAVLTTVDLNTRQVVDVERVQHMPTPLAAEEFARAKDLIRSDDRLSAFWAEHGDGLTIEGKVGYAPRTDPTFGRRTVYLLFRDGRNYLTQPRVMVDLTDETVQVDFAPRPGVE